MDEDIVIPIAGMVFVLVLVFGSIFLAGYNKRVQRRSEFPRANPQDDERLERMEHAIDAMSIEIERIAEGQRFVTKLLAERPSDMAAIASPVVATSQARSNR